MDGSQGSASSSRKLRSSRGLRILMQMRDNALTQRGGDTVVMERLTAGLKELGHQVDVDLLGKIDPAQYDLVHLYNFCTPDVTEKFAKNAVSRGTPFVATTMYEDWPFFFNKMLATYLVFKRYIELGQPTRHWDEMISSISNVPTAEAQRNEYTAAHAESLFPSGENELKTLLRDYPTIKRTDLYHYGAQVSETVADPEIFRKQYGIQDFVLCVGRVEWRKNQLMILKALEDVEIDVVFFTGGFTYQPEYEKLCRAYKRRGRTHFIDKVPSDILSSAFAGARAHVLPSWYELPGLVTIEAANAGTNVVVSENGTIRDYIGERGFYCQPHDSNSIRDAIEAAWNAPRNLELQEHVRQFTWEKSSKRTEEIYLDILDGVSTTQSITTENGILKSVDNVRSEVELASEQVFTLQTVNPTPELKADDIVERFTEKCVQGDLAARQGNNASAENLYREALRIYPQGLRAHRGLGVLALTSLNYADAEAFFHAALSVEPSDNASETGFATARWYLGHKEEAFAIYSKVLKRMPDHSSTLTYFINACYELGRYRALSDALETYLQIHPTSKDMIFALSGAYLKEERRFAAGIMAEEVERRDPGYPGLAELKEIIAKEPLEPLAESPVATVTADPEAPTAQSASILEAPPEVLIEEPRSDGALVTEILKLEELLRRREYTHALDLSAKLLNRPQISEHDRAYVGILAGEAHACRGDLIAAEAEFRRFESDSRFGYRAVTGKGIVAAERKQWEEAEAFFHHALSMNPTHDVAVAGIAMSLAQKGDQEGAWCEYQRSLQLNPENMRAILGTIDIGYRLGRLDEVRQSLEAYLEYNPGNLSMLYAHAGCLYAQGNSGLAKNQLEKIKIFEPEHPLANELLDKIQSEIQPTYQRVSIQK